VSDGVAVETSYVYIADQHCGLQIYENLLVGVEEDENYELGIMHYELSVYPNPFREKTVIGYRLSVTNRLQITSHRLPSVCMT